MVAFSPKDGAEERQKLAVSHEFFPLNDLALARAIAHAVCKLPGVAEMSPGFSSIHATYGPGGHIDGVVLQRRLPDELMVDLYVVAARSELRAPPCRGNAHEAVAEQMPRLLVLGQQIRETAARTIAQLGLSTSLTVNVTLDDVC
ncbi:MAG TPA: hypothetical protein VKV19_14165 [Ktedonobacteraceae bacterium]|nr:hypothetical protein [Ktedonobacteraceae bacterium]